MGVAGSKLGDISTCTFNIRYRLLFHVIGYFTFLKNISMSFSHTYSKPTRSGLGEDSQRYGEALEPYTKIVNQLKA